MHTHKFKAARIELWANGAAVTDGYVCSRFWVSIRQRSSTAASLNSWLQARDEACTHTRTHMYSGAQTQTVWQCCGCNDQQGQKRNVCDRYTDPLSQQMNKTFRAYQILNCSTYHNSVTCSWPVNTSIELGNPQVMHAKLANLKYIL